jgi:D-alanyl-D-alanine carboxypeptidase
MTLVDELAAEFEAALDDMAGGVGMSATVMTADGTWTGTVRKADGDRDLRADDQFAIASGTTPVVAAQGMEMVEARQLALDDPVADHLPPDLEFDINSATIRQLPVGPQSSQWSHRGHGRTRWRLRPRRTPRRA